MKSLYLICFLIIFFFIQDIGATEIKACRECNIILISIDTLRADRLGSFNPKSKLTPNIDALAKTAISYQRAYAQAPWTLPSHRAVFTGIHPWKLPDGPDPAPSLGIRIAPKITELLEKENYETAAITSGEFINKENGFDKGFGLFKLGDKWNDAEFFSKEAIKWLKRKHDKKFFLFLHSFHTHEPFEPAKKIVDQIDPHGGELYTADRSLFVEVALGRFKLPAKAIHRIPFLYDAEVIEIDRALGEIFQVLRQTKLDKKTVIIFFSDHGLELGDRGIMGLHGYDLYDEFVHVPLLLKMPGLTPAKIQSPVEVTDIFSTILKIADLPLLPNVDSVPLPVKESKKSWSRIATSLTTSDRYSFVGGIPISVKTPYEKRFPTTTVPKITPHTKMIVKDHYKLKKTGDDFYELYDLSKDPGEKEDLYHTDPKTAEDLKKVMTAEF